MAKLTGAQCDAMFNSLSIEKKRAITNIIFELNGAEEKHPIWPTAEFLFDGNQVPKGDFVHAAAIVCEEAGELIRAALQYAWEGGKYYDMHNEAIQVGSTAIRFLINAPELPFDEDKEVNNG